ncbi:MAG: protein kinase, partial [Planctomycetes bacterium]|nr:protein kinase [Planctomycetota bacterium]
MSQIEEDKPGSLSFFRRKGAEERPQPGPGLAPGKVVGDFRLVSLIGQGGMGQVWEAEQFSLHRTVAVKFVRPERVTERQLELFAREARAGGRLAHPGIVSVHGYGQSDGLAWIAMEFVGGAWTLKDFLDEAARAEEVPAGYDRHVARFVAEIAEAMQTAHEAGVIHRDLKPQNVLITSEDRPKVTDFGLARITDESAMSQTGDFAGTYYYMSPEQVTARRMGIDHRSDIFSLGIVLYELLALRRPFEGDTSHQVAAQIVTKDPPDIRTIRSRVPRDLAVIAGKALEKDRDKRFAAMKALAADLRRHLANEPIHATPPTRLDRAVKWTKRNPGKSSAAAIVAVTFTVIAFLFVANVRTNRALERERTNLATTNTALESERANLASANVALEGKTTEALENARVAKTNEQRAVTGEALAREEKEHAEKKADEVLRLSALQRLEDLTNEAARLWPAHPENIVRYEAWLARAEKLVAELPGHEQKLAELRTKARPWTAAERAEFRALHPQAKDLERIRRELDFLKAHGALLEGGEPGPEPTPSEVGVDFARLPADADALNTLAWPQVDPVRTKFGGEKKGLVLARRAVELAGENERAGIRDTLAWALFALGRFDEALVEEEQALKEAAAEKKAEFEGYVTKLRAAIEAELGPEASETARERASVLEGELAAIEGALSTRPEWTFDDDEDKWWHNQLEKLVSGIQAFADERTGLLSEGTSPETGWGVKKRLANALLLRAGFAPEGEHAKAWSAVMPAIRSAYPGLTLTPQLGLLPLGPDPDSGLWELAHLATGEPAVRGADGKLVLTEATGLVFVLLRGGTFQMGAQKSDPNGMNYDPQAQSGEGPVHAVTLSPFLLSKYEMTQGQWLRFVGKNPSYYQPPGGLAPSLLHPAEQVSWLDCMGIMERLGLSLPSEAQWEYGARGGTSSVWWPGDERQKLIGAVSLADQAAARGGATWSDIKDWPELDDGFVVHAPVERFAPNPFGLHNVHGNVWEWCLDGYDIDFYKQAA